MKAENYLMRQNFKRTHIQINHATKDKHQDLSKELELACVINGPEKKS